MHISKNIGKSLICQGLAGIDNNMKNNRITQGDYGYDD